MKQNGLETQQFLQAQHGLHGDEERRNVEGLKEDLCGLLSVLTGVKRSLSQQHRMLANNPNTTGSAAAQEALCVKTHTPQSEAHLL